MKFGDIRGNNAAITALRGMADSGRVPQAMLFYENPASGGLALATAFAQYLCCGEHEDGDSCGHCPSCVQASKLIHPDIHYVFPVNKGDAVKADHPVSDMGITEFRELFASNPCFTEQELYQALGVESKSGIINVYEARSIVSKMSLSSVAGSYKVVIVFLPERFNTEAANTLLKLVEEPPSQTVFLFVTQSPENVMPTIVSRCQGLRIIPFDDSQLVCSSESEELVEIWDRLQNALLAGNLLSALEVADSLDALKSREKQKAFCTFASEQIRKIFLCSKGLSDIAQLDSSRPSLESAARKFSPKLCLRTSEYLNKAAMLLSRNVSAKMVFTDLVNRIYVNL